MSYVASFRWLRLLCTISKQHSSTILPRLKNSISAFVAVLQVLDISANLAEQLPSGVLELTGLRELHAGAGMGKRT